MENLTNESKENFEAKLVKQGKKLLWLNIIFLFLIIFLSISNLLLLPFDVIANSKNTSMIYILGFIAFLNLIISFSGIYKFIQMRKNLMNKKALAYFLFLFSIINVFISILLLLDIPKLLKIYS